MISIESRN